MDSYQIVSIVEADKSRGVLVNVMVNGSSKIFQKSLKEIYAKGWLERFSSEDVAYIGFLSAAALNENSQLINNFPRRKNSITKNVVFMAMFFVCFLILSNITAFKIGTIKLPFSTQLIEFPGALVFFPVTYIFSNILTEVYGYKITRMIIWCGFAASAVMLLGFWITKIIPPSQEWLNNTKNLVEFYDVLFTSYARVFIASSVAYFFGEFLNSMILAKLKILSSGKHLYARVVGSTMIAVSVDSAIFCFIAFFGIMSGISIMWIVVTQFTLKVIYEICMLPVTYKIVSYLKNRDKVNYFDTKTKFNPFSLRMED